VVREPRSDQNQHQNRRQHQHQSQHQHQNQHQHQHQHQDMEVKTWQRCPVCDDEYHGTARLLPCLHTVCDLCEHDLCDEARRRAPPANVPACPVCLEPFGGQAGHLPFNYVVESALRRGRPLSDTITTTTTPTSTTSTSTQDDGSTGAGVSVGVDDSKDESGAPSTVPMPTCEYHPRLVVTMFCTDCGRAVCAQCSDDAGHSGHTLIELDEAAVQLAEALGALLDQLKAHEADVARAVQLLDERIRDVAAREPKLTAEVNEAFATVADCLSEHIEDLQQSLRDEDEMSPASPTMSMQEEANGDLLSGGSLTASTRTSDRRNRSAISSSSSSSNSTANLLNGLRRLFTSVFSFGVPSSEQASSSSATTLSEAVETTTATSSAAGFSPTSRTGSNSGLGLSSPGASSTHHRRSRERRQQQIKSRYRVAMDNILEQESLGGESQHGSATRAANPNETIHGSSRRRGGRPGVVGGGDDYDDDDDKDEYSRDSNGDETDNRQRAPLVRPDSRNDLKKFGASGWILSDSDSDRNSSIDVMSVTGSGFLDSGAVTPLRDDISEVPSLEAAGGGDDSGLVMQSPPSSKRQAQQQRRPVSQAVAAGAAALLHRTSSTQSTSSAVDSDLYVDALSTQDASVLASPIEATSPSPMLEDELVPVPSSPPSPPVLERPRTRSRAESVSTVLHELQRRFVQLDGRRDGIIADVHTTIAADLKTLQLQRDHLLVEREKAHNIAITSARLVDHAFTASVPRGARVSARQLALTCARRILLQRPRQEEQQPGAVPAAYLPLVDDNLRFCRPLNLSATDSLRVPLLKLGKLYRNRDYREISAPRMIVNLRDLGVILPLGVAWSSMHEMIIVTGQPKPELQEDGTPEQTSGGCIFVMDKDGKPMRRIDGFPRPTGVDVLVGGEMCVADLERGRLHVISIPTGESLRTIACSCPIGVASVINGTIVATRSSAHVTCFHADGRVRWSHKVRRLLALYKILIFECARR